MRQSIQALTVAMLFIAIVLSVNAQQTQPQQTQGQTQPAVQQQPQAAPPPCEAPKKPAFWERAKHRAQERLERAAQAQIDNAGAKASKDTHGKVDGSALPSVQDVTTAAPKQPKPCAPVPPADTKQ